MPLIGLSTDTLVLLELSCFLAFLIKGLAGFGSALVFVPCLSLVLGTDLALSTSALLDLTVNAMMIFTFKYRRSDIAILAPMVLMLVVGTVIGGILAGAVPDNAILTIMATVILIFGLNLVLFRQQVPKKLDAHGSKSVMLGCLFGGVGSGLVGISGPFIVVALRPKADKSDFRRLLVAMFMIGSVFRIITYASVGVWSPDAIKYAILGVPGIALGLFLGYRLHNRISERSFTVVIGLIILALSGRIFWRLLT